MRFFWSMLLLMIGWILVEQNFLEILFPSLGAPVIAIALGIAFVVTLGFERGFWWAIATGITADILEHGVITMVTLTVLLSAYTASFLGRRFTFHTRGLGQYLFVTILLFAVVLFQWQRSLWSLPHATDIILVFLVWPLVLFTVQRLYTGLEARSKSEFRGLRGGIASTKL